MTSDELQERRDKRARAVNETLYDEAESSNVADIPRTSSILLARLIEAIDDHAATMEQSLAGIENRLTEVERTLFRD